jgi:hypothetical protein
MYFSSSILLCSSFALSISRCRRAGVIMVGRVLCRALDGRPGAVREGHQGVQARDWVHTARSAAAGEPSRVALAVRSSIHRLQLDAAFRVEPSCQKLVGIQSGAKSSDLLESVFARKGKSLVLVGRTRDRAVVAASSSEALPEEPSAADVPEGPLARQRDVAVALSLSRSGIGREALPCSRAVVIDCDTCFAKEHLGTLSAARVVESLEKHFRVVLWGADGSWSKSSVHVPESAAVTVASAKHRAVCRARPVDLADAVCGCGGANCVHVVTDPLSAVLDGERFLILTGEPLDDAGKSAPWIGLLAYLSHAASLAPELNHREHRQWRRVAQRLLVDDSEARWMAGLSSSAPAHAQYISHVHGDSCGPSCSLTHHHHEDGAPRHHHSHSRDEDDGEEEAHRDEEE